MKLEIIIGSIIFVVLGIGAFFVFLPAPEASGVVAPSGAVEEVPVDATATSAVAPETPAKDTAKDTIPAAPKAPVTLADVAAKKAALYKKSAELVAPDGYINTDGKEITIGEFRGKKVVLVDIWTFSCINCQRTLPYLKDWYNKYSDKGLEIIGVHTPEFAFEKLQKNVQSAVTEEGIRYPVVLDNAYKTWNAFGNQYWPRKYLIDIDGYIVYDHAGEGQYAETEMAIQKALAERAERLGLNAPDMPDTTAQEVAANGRVKSPETYFGAWRNSNFGNGTQSEEGTQTLSIPTDLKANTLYLGGVWNFKREYVRNESMKAQIRFRYDARNVFFVGASDVSVRVKVTRDGGKPLGDARGADVGEDGIVVIGEDRLYKLIEDTTYGPHTLEMEVEEAGLEAYTFTFG